MNQLLKNFYEQHHIKGNRLRKTFLEEKRVQIFSEWLGTGKKVLDVGCRDGTLTKHFIKDNEIIGIDIDERALKYASEKHNLKTMLIDLNHKLPFEDNSFDAVIMAEVIEHLPYLEITLSEIARITKPDGLIIGNVPLAYHLKDRYQVVRGKALIVAGDSTHLRYFSYDDLIKLLIRHFNDPKEIKVLKGTKPKFIRWSKKAIKLFAWNVAFLCTNNKG